MIGAAQSEYRLMTYKGHVKNGTVVLNEGGALPEGALVTVEIAGEDAASSLLDHYRSLIGAIDDLPEDWSENHDAYLRTHCG